MRKSYVAERQRHIDLFTVATNRLSLMNTIKTYQIISLIIIGPQSKQDVTNIVLLGEPGTTDDERHWLPRHPRLISWIEWIETLKIH